VGLALGSACGSSESGSGAPAGEPAAEPAAEAPAPAAAAQAGAPDGAAREEAKQIFSTRCFTCHGMEGAGDGPGSAGLTPAPRNFQDAAWQESVSDEHLTNIILYGGAAVGKSPMMPGNPDLNGKPAVVAALVEHIRSLGK
jgi:mono/diheme cytochrome c family protein